MKRETLLGIAYSNERLGLEEDLYPLNTQFLPEGKEYQITPDTWIIGHIPPLNKNTCAQLIIADSEGVLFVSQRYINKLQGRES